MYMRNCLLIALFLCSPFIMAENNLSPQLGIAVSQRLVQQWNRDIFTDGEGLPPGKGTAVFGKKVYQQHCESCHGTNGTGSSADELAGAQYGLKDDPPDKIIGTYWPYATTLFDFTRRSMPLNAPGSLTINELYAVTAYLLFLNGLVDENTIINQQTLPAVKMPNRDGFIDFYRMDN